MSEDTICGECGRVHKTWHGHPSCRGHKVHTDPLEPCTKPPKGMTGYCRSHGANLPGIARAGELREQKLALMSAQGEIADLMRECDIPDQHPIDGLLEVVRVSGAMMRLLTIKVGELAEDPTMSEVLVETKKGDLYTKQVADGDAFWGLNKDSEMTPHIYVTLLRMWTERYERACKTALEAGIEERRIALAEDTVETFFTSLQRATAIAGLDPAQQAALMQALAGELRVATNVIDLI